MTIEMTPALWWGLLGLAPLVIYIILVFRDVDILSATAICVVIGAVIHASPRPSTTRIGPGDGTPGLPCALTAGQSPG